MKLTSEQVESNKNEFLGLLDKAAELKPENKEGIDGLKDYLINSDFFIAPAASNKDHHGCYEGGLCLHSLNVYREMLRQIEAHKEMLDTEIPEYSIIITSLLHDLCKINRYKKQVVGHYEKNEDGTVALDNNGRKIWVEEEGYAYAKLPTELGHAARSIYAIMRFIKLSGKEAEAIYWHMGPFDLGNYSTVSDMSKAYSNNKLAFFLQLSDYTETYLQGKE